jgi:hypothetical protein
VEIGSDAEIRWTGHLLHLSPDGIKRALTTKTTVSPAALCNVSLLTVARKGQHKVKQIVVYVLLME